MKNTAQIDKASLYWLSIWFEEHGIELWGAADLSDLTTPKDECGKQFPSAISFVVPINPEIMCEVATGPTPSYLKEYEKINKRINHLSAQLADYLAKKGSRASALDASKRTDNRRIRGAFPHKTAATRAGLGWIGRHCQLVTRKFGSWVRLGTVFTDLDLIHGPPVEQNYCGSCRKCVDACPSSALSGRSWKAGKRRYDLLNVKRCDDWMKQQHDQENTKGRLCGICSAVCPYGLKQVITDRYGVSRDLVR